jgi:anti-anti-sigma factor
MDLPMDLRIEVHGSHPARVVLEGELDLATAPELWACFLDLNGDIEVDCSGLDFTDAAGLGVFVQAHTRCEQAGAKLMLIDPSAFVLRVIEVAKLDSLLNVRCENEASR